MKLLLTAFVFALGAQFASAAECSKRIILLPQLLAKRSPIAPGPVALSQFLVWREIAARPGVPVFTENVAQDVSADDEKPVLFDASFPKEVPEHFYQLSHQEKAALSAIGGDQAALNGGQTQTLMAVMAGHDAKTGHDRVRKALGEVKSYFSLNEDLKEVILVFGAEFDLKKYDDVFDPACIEIPSQTAAALQ